MTIFRTISRFGAWFTGALTVLSAAGYVVMLFLNAYDVSRRALLVLAIVFAALFVWMISEVIADSRN